MLAYLNLILADSWTRSYYPAVPYSTVMWDCSRGITVRELRAIRARYDAYLQTYPLANGTALSLNQLVILFQRPATPYLQKIFKEYMLWRVCPAGLSFMRPPEPALTHRLEIPLIPGTALPHAQKADLAEILVSVALTAEGTFEDRMWFLFEIFDLNNDGTLQRDELHALLSTVARATTKLQLTLTSTDGIAIEVAVASALCYGGRGDDLLSYSGIAEIHDHSGNSIGDESEDDVRIASKDEQEYGICLPSNNSDRLSQGSNEDDVALPEYITQKDFVLWSVQDAVPCQFRVLCGVASRARALIELWEGRAKQLARRNDICKVHPRWALAAFGTKGSRNAWAAQELAVSLAVVTLASTPFIIALPCQGLFVTRPG